MTHPGTPKLVVEGVSRRFGTFEALKEVSIEVGEGSVLALLGPSGSGKSTLLKLIGGHDMPDAGDIVIDGASIVGLPPERIPTATVFQHYALFPHYDVFKNVAFGLRVRKQSASVIRDTVEQVLETVGLAGFGDRDVSTLSGGERQRVAMARALAVRPQLILMDEPLGALDRLIRLSMQHELGRLLHQLGITTVYVTHDQHEAFTLADRIAVMEQGRVHQIGTPLEIYRDPVNRFVAHFVGGTNFLSGKVAAVTPDAVILDVDEGVRIVGRSRPGETFVEGQEAVALIRPEDVLLRPHDPTAGVAVEIAEVEYIGDITQYTIRLRDGREITAKELGWPSFETGTRLAAEWSTAPLILRQ